MEELAKKHSLGLVTTHYLNLKVMANKVNGIINGAMAFDEKNLKPLYHLIIGKPGSSYTFSIAERIGLPQHLIKRAKSLVDENHFSLDRLLNSTEQDQQLIQAERKQLDKLLKENEKLQIDMEQLIQKEKHTQQLEIMKAQNEVNEAKIIYLKEMEKKLKSLLIEWRKTEDKNKVVRMMQALLFKQPEKKVLQRKQQKLESRYLEIGGNVKQGDKVIMKSNQQLGVVKDIRGKKAIVQVGAVPITVSLDNLAIVIEKNTPER